MKKAWKNREEVMKIGGEQVSWPVFFGRAKPSKGPIAGSNSIFFTSDVADYPFDAKKAAEALVLELTPRAPDHVTYKKLWPAVLTKHAVLLTEVNSICAALKKKNELVFLDWGPRDRVPKDDYRTQRPA